jgi:DNA repair exonuclease SbcCD ATPase subunit
MITLKKVTILDFLSHEKTEISFKGKESLLISGTSGSGKSSIVDAIVWALYGVARSENRSLIRFGQKQASVELVLVSDSIEYKITRTITKTKHSLAVASMNDSGEWVANELTGVKELDVWIEKLIGASYTLFSNSVAYIQDNKDNFVSQTAPKRKELLLEIIKTVDFDSLYEKTKQTIQGVNDQILKAETALSLHMHTLASSKERTSRLQGKIETIKTLQLEHPKLLTSLEDARRTVAGFDGARNSLTVLEESSKSTSSRIASLNKTILSLQSEIASIPKLETDIAALSTKESDLLMLQASLNALQSSVDFESSQNAEYTKCMASKPPEPKPCDPYYQTKLLELSGSINKCPSGDSCPYEIPRFNEKNFILDKVTQEGARFVAEMSTFSVWKAKIDTVKVPDFEVLRKMESDLNAKRNEVFTVKSALSQLPLLQFKLSEAKKKQADLSEAQGIHTKEVEAVSVLDEQIKTARGSFDSVAYDKVKASLVVFQLAADTHTQQIAQLSAEISALEEDIKKEVALEQEITLLVSKEIEPNKVMREKLLLLKDAFSSAGIKSMVVDYIAPALEDKINSVLSRLSHFKVRIDTQKDKVSGDGKTEGLYITVIDDMGNECAYENTSGGERIKIQMSIAEALASLQKCGFRIMDENITALSSEMVTDLVSVLKDLVSKYPQVFIISHIQEVKEEFSNVLTVTKRDGISSVS